MSQSSHLMGPDDLFSSLDRRADGRDNLVTCPDLRPSEHKSVCEWFGPGEARPVTRHAGELAVERAGQEPWRPAAPGAEAASLFRGLF